MTIGVHSAGALTPYETELARRVESQSLACIGCNDCLLACPIVESRSVTIGELNNALRLPVLTQRNVVAFVTACTQCSQCVPVCPADLNRAEMVLFNKLKVEDSVADHELLLQARTVTFPSGWSLDGLSSRLTEVELFNGATVTALRRLLLKSTLRLLVPGEELVKEGEFHERLSLVLSGALSQVTNGPRGEPLRILTLGPGSFFGGDGRTRRRTGTVRSRGTRKEYRAGGTEGRRASVDGSRALGLRYAGQPVRPPRALDVCEKPWVTGSAPRQRDRRALRPRRTRFMPGRDTPVLSERPARRPVSGAERISPRKTAGSIG